MKKEIKYNGIDIMLIYGAAQSGGNFSTETVGGVGVVNPLRKELFIKSFIVYDMLGIAKRRGQGKILTAKQYESYSEIEDSVSRDSLEDFREDLTLFRTMLDSEIRNRLALQNDPVMRLKADRRRIPQPQNGITVHGGDILFSDYIKQWLEETSHTISSNTYFSYRQTVHNIICPYFECRQIKLGELTSAHISEFYNFRMSSHGTSANTIHHYHANIRRALEYAVKSELIEKNPSDNAELPKKEKHVAQFYTKRELKILLEHARGTQIEPIVRLASWFGLRRGEIIGLKWSSVDFKKKILTIDGTVKDKGPSGSAVKNLHYEQKTKTASSVRSFPLSAAMLAYFRELRAEQEANKRDNPHYNYEWEEFVCVRSNGDLIPPEYVSKAFPKLCRKSGLKRLRLHELRHTNISILLENGASMKELQEWAGHSSYTTTANIYSHLQAQSKQRLAKSIEKIIG